MALIGLIETLPLAGAAYEGRCGTEHRYARDDQRHEVDNQALGTHDARERHGTDEQPEEQPQEPMLRAMAAPLEAPAHELIEAENIDGEAIYARTVDIKLLPGALRLIVPRGMRFFEDQSR